jgi:hypothetical protein
MQTISLTSGALATAISHPFEFLKTKIQIYNEGIGIRQKGNSMGYNANRVFQQLYEAGYGNRVLYTGFGEALVGRLAYLAIRNTIYKFIYDRKKPVKITNDLTHREKGFIGAIAGGVATAVTHPLETVMVRKIGEVGRSAHFHRANLRHDLYNGLSFNVLRAMVLNGIIIWPYDVMKERSWIAFGEVWINRFIGVTAAALVGTVATIPIDMIKTRQCFAYSDRGLNRLNYANGFDVVLKAYLNEGHLTYFAGAWPYFARIWVYSAVVT